MNNPLCRLFFSFFFSGGGEEEEGGRKIIIISLTDNEDLRSAAAWSAELQIFFKNGEPGCPMEQNMVGHFLKLRAQSYRINTIFTYIQKCNGTGTRLESDEVTQKQNDYALENLSELYPTALITCSFYKSLVKYYIHRLTSIHICL